MNTLMNTHTHQRTNEQTNQQTRRITIPPDGGNKYIFRASDSMFLSIDTVSVRIQIFNDIMIRLYYDILLIRLATTNT